MTRSASLVLHCKDLEIDDTVRDAIQRRCDGLAEEFHEVGRIELTLSEDGVGFLAHGHAIGKNTDVATHATGEQPRVASDQVLDKIERQLRKTHDKRIFGRRREAQKDPPKRRETR